MRGDRGPGCCFPGSVADMRTRPNAAAAAVAAAAAAPGSACDAADEPRSRVSSAADGVRQDPAVGGGCDAA